MNSTIYHAMNLCTTAVFCSGIGLIFGYGWGCESTMNKTTVTRKEKRVKRFKTTHKEGLKPQQTKKISPLKGLNIFQG